MKELRFHPQFGTLIVTTSEDSFNLFRPNLEPDFEEPALEKIIEDPDEETKQDSSSISS